MFFNKYGIKSRNIDIICVNELLWGLLFFLPVLTLYIQGSLGGAAEVGLIIAIQSISSLLLEIPTGALGDLIGRKKTVFLGNAAYLVSLVFLYWGGSIEIFIIYAILSGACFAMFSGTYTALIYDSLKEEGKGRHFKNVNGAILSIWPFFAAIGAVVGGTLAATSLQLTILATMVPIGLSTLLCLFIKEPKYEKPKDNSMVRQMKDSAKAILGNRQLLILTAAAAVIFGAGESMYYLYPIILNAKGLAVTEISYLFAGMFLLSSAGHYFSQNVSERLGDKNTLILRPIITSILIVGATLSFGLFAGLLIALTSLFFGFYNPVMEYMMNLEAKSDKRATILSISSMMSRLGLAAMVVFMGYVADAASIETAYLGVAAVLLGAAGLLLMVKDKQ